MRALPYAIFLTVLAIPAVSFGGQLRPQSTASWEAAVRNKSTNIPYVMLTIVDDRDGSSRTGCVTVNAVIGAIYRDRGMPQTLASFATIDRILLENVDHVVHLSKPEAFANLGSFAGPQAIEAARSLPANTRAARSFLESEIEQSALACLAIGDGKSPFQADRTGGLVIPD